MARKDSLDAEELFETPTVTADNLLFCADLCHIGSCRSECSLEVVDELLSMPDAVTGEEVDLLLDFRSLLRARCDAEGTLRLFCDLCRRLEQRHYLAFYRLRRWLENHVVAMVSSAGSNQNAHVHLRLEFYCVEAIRRQCVCVALQQRIPGSSLRFIFVRVPEPVQSH